MQVPPHIKVMTPSELQDYVCNTPGHNPTPLEMYLVSGHYSYAMTKLEEEVSSLKVNVRELESELDEKKNECLKLSHDLQIARKYR